MRYPPRASFPGKRIRVVPSNKGIGSSIGTASPVSSLNKRTSWIFHPGELTTATARSAFTKAISTLTEKSEQPVTIKRTTMNTKAIFRNILTLQDENRNSVTRDLLNCRQARLKLVKPKLPATRKRE